jgi:uncharacterized repeat protein (TIGR01451 family)
MKKLLLSVIALTAILIGANAQTYYYDSFDYTAGNLGVATGQVTPAVNPATSATNSNWNYGSTKSALVQTGSLTYPGLATSATSTKDIKLVNAGSAVNQKMTFATVGVTTPVYYSFLMKISAAPTAATRVASLIGTTRTDITTLGTYTANIQVDASGKVLLAPDNNGITAATAITSTSVVGTTVLVVVKYNPSTYNTDIWVNPASSTLGAGADPTPLVAGIVGGATTDASGFTFKTGTGVVNAEIDELRIGNSWADVTQSQSSPDIKVTQAVDNAAPATGTNVTMTVTATNVGTAAASNVTIADNLPAGLTLVSATPSTGSWSAPNWSGINLAAGASATLAIVATSSTAVSVRNLASVAPTAPDVVQTNDSASVAVSFAVATGITSPSAKALQLSTTRMTDYVTVTGDAANGTKVDFISVDGKAAKSVVVSANQPILVSDLAKGLYIVRISSQGTVVTVKAVKE